MGDELTGPVVVGEVMEGESDPHRRPFTRARQPEAGTFLDGLAEGMSPLAAAKLARIHRATAYAWRDSDEGFAAAWEVAYTAGTEFIEQEAHRRAVFGAEEPVWYRGQQVGTVRKPSDRLMELMLKARAPEKYRERVDHTITATPMTPEELQRARTAGMSAEVEAAAALLASVPVVDEEQRSS